MALPKGLNAQRDFSAGQIDGDANRRDDTDLFKAGCSQLLNAEILATGAVTRRAGLRHRAEVLGGRLARIRPTDGYEFDVIFRDGEAEFINVADEDTQTVTGCPWTSDDLDYLSWAAVEKRVYVAAPGVRTQVLRFNGTTGNWSRVDFDFREGMDGTSRMPFYRFEKGGTKIRVTGNVEIGSTVTVEFDDSVLDAGHVGTILLYGKSQMQIDSVTSATEAECTVLQTLPRFWKVFINANDDADTFRVGDVVEGDTYQSKGQVVEIASADNAVIVLNFEIDGRYQGEEILIGPNASGKIKDSGETEVVAGPYWTTLWEEQFISDFRGWPGGVSYDRSRLIFYNFAQLPDAFLESAIGDPLDFQVGSTATEAIFERTPDADHVLHVIGGHDQFVLTDNGIYYIPISVNNPLQPGSVQLVKVGSGGVSDTVKPVSTSRGVVYVPDDGRRVVAIRQTGEDTRSYVIDDIARFHTSLISTPVALATSPVGQRGVLETLYVINSTGSAAVGAYTVERDWVGFVRWTTDGRFLDVSAFGDGLTFMTRRDVDGAPSAFIALEELDTEIKIDGAIDLPAALYGGASVWVTSGNAAYGPITLESDGSLPTDIDDIPDGVAGLAFTFRLEPMMENFDSGESRKQRLHRRKINRWAVTVRQAQEFTVNDAQIRAGYEVGDDLGEAQTLRNRTFTGGSLGRSWEPTFEVEQAWPGSITVTEIGMEIM